MKLYSTKDAAKQIGIHPETLRYYAHKHGYGTMIGNNLMFTNDDIKAVKEKRESRTRK